MGNKLSFVVAVGVPVVTGSVIGVASVKDIKGWYKKLKKPSWTPPNWIFGPVWTVLYTSMGVASWLVWKQKDKGRVLPLTLYVAQLLLNFAWSPLFFSAHKLQLATADSAAMLGVAAAATFSMSRAAGGKAVVPLMAPYLLWVSYATALTYTIMKDNKEAEKLADTPTEKEAAPPAKQEAEAE